MQIIFILNISKNCMCVILRVYSPIGKFTHPEIMKWVAELEQTRKGHSTDNQIQNLTQ